LLIGSAQADTLYGADGNDTLKGMGGADILVGGDGVDTASYDESPQRVVVSLGGSPGYLGDAEGDLLYDIENLSGSDHDDRLEGDRGDNILWGMSGDDHLLGAGADDILHGGWGHDTLSGGDGHDTLWGESGNDTFLADSGTNTMIGGPGNDTYYLSLGDGDIVIETGGQGVDVVITLVSWTLTAGADVETLQTFDENDTDPIDLTGNSAGNTVRGNAGSNVINGGGGNDELIGLGGTDGFRFDTELDATFNVDVLPDFDVEDVIQLDDAVFGALATGVLAAERFVIGAAAQDADDNVIYDDVTGALLYDSDGAGGAAAIQFAQANPGLGISNQDFIVV
jgi:Ca2+-binding RTX toxin-like protein